MVFRRFTFNQSYEKFLIRGDRRIVLWWTPAANHSCSCSLTGVAVMEFSDNNDAILSRGIWPATSLWIFTTEITTVTLHSAILFTFIVYIKKKVDKILNPALINVFNLQLLNIITNLHLKFLLQFGGCNIFIVLKISLKFHLPFHLITLWCFIEMIVTVFTFKLNKSYIYIPIVYKLS